MRAFLLIAIILFVAAYGTSYVSPAAGAVLAASGLGALAISWETRPHRVGGRPAGHGDDSLPVGSVGD